MAEIVAWAVGAFLACWTIDTLVTRIAARHKEEHGG